MKICTFAYMGIVLGAILSGCATGSFKDKPDEAAAEADLSNGRIVQLQRQVEQSPTDSRLYFALGNACFDAARYEEAFAAYQNCMKLEPDFVEAYTNLGLTLRRMGREQAAMGAYEYALDLKPDHELTLENMKVLAEALGDVPRFQRALEQLARMKPRDVLLQGQLADMWFQMGRYEDAIPVYEKLLLLEPAEVLNIHRLGLCHYYVGRLDQAELIFRQGLRSHPEHGDLLGAVAVVLWEMGDYEGAWAAVGECQRLGIALNPEFLESLRSDSGRGE